MTGRGPDRIADIEWLGPLVRDVDVVALGEREDYPEWRDIHETDITVWDLGELRALGTARAALKFVGRMEVGGVDGFWIHLDADVLDDAIMPAVDSRQPDGLSYSELVELLRVLLRLGLAVGMEVTIFDPELDPTGGDRRRVHGCFGRGLQGASLDKRQIPGSGQKERARRRRVLDDSLTTTGTNIGGRPRRRYPNYQA